VRLLSKITAVVEAAVDREFVRPLMDDLQRPSYNLGTHLLLYWLSLTRPPKGQQLYENLRSILQAVGKGDFSLTDVSEADLTPEPIPQSSEDSSNE